MNTTAKATVYMVDDDDAVRDSLKILLESHGMDVCDYKSAGDFLSVIGAGVRGCLVLDLHLPVLSGLDLIKIMRQRKIPLPVVFITGRSDDDVKGLAMRAGAVAFLEKPVMEESLMAAIHTALSKLSKPFSPGVATASVSVERGCQAPSPSGQVREGFSPASFP